MAKKKQSPIAEEIDNFLEVYIEGSTIKEIVYNAAKDKWQLKFKDKTYLEFDSFEEMREWLHADQFGD